MQVTGLKALSLLTKYGTLRVDDLTVSIVQDIADSLGFEIIADQRTLDAVVVLLRSADIDGLADLASKPEVLARVAQFFMRAEPQSHEVIRVCNHCGNFNIYEVTP